MTKTFIFDIAFIFFIFYFLQTNKCSGLLIPSTNYKVYLDLYSSGYYLGYLLWIVLLSSLPIGRKASYAHVHVRLMGKLNL